MVLLGGSAGSRTWPVLDDSQFCPRAYIAIDPGRRQCSESESDGTFQSEMRRARKSLEARCRQPALPTGCQREVRSLAGSAWRLFDSRCLQTGLRSPRLQPDGGFCWLRLRCSYSEQCTGRLRALSYRAVCGAQKSVRAFGAFCTFTKSTEDHRVLHFTFHAVYRRMRGHDNIHINLSSEGRLFAVRRIDEEQWD